MPSIRPLAAITPGTSAAWTVDRIVTEVLNP